MSNYRAQYSQNLSQTEIFKFTIMFLKDVLYLNIKDLILQSYLNTITHVNSKRLGELTCEENKAIVERGLFWKLLTISRNDQINASYFYVYWC